MKTNKIFLLLIALLFSASIAFAFTHQSAYYTLMNPRIVTSGGSASSINFKLEYVGVGRVGGGKAASPSYTLDASAIDRRIPPDTPLVDPVISPTTIPTQTLTGAKDRYSSIYINGAECVSLDSEITWNYEVALSEGDNLFVVTSKNIYGQESKAVSVTIVLTATSPEVHITSHQDGVTIYAEP